MRLRAENENKHTCLTCKARSGLFDLLSDGELMDMEEGRCRVNFRAGETVRKQGTHLSHVLSVNSGYCKMYIEGVESRDIILRIIKPTSFIGGPGLFVDFRHHFTVSALTDASVCMIDSGVFRQVLDSNKRFAEQFMAEMSRNTISVYNRIISLTQKQMAGRIADTLIYLADEIFDSHAYDLILSKQEIADFTKMSRDNVVRVLKTFDNDKLIRLSKERIEILDYQKLSRISSIG